MVYLNEPNRMNQRIFEIVSWLLLLFLIILSLLLDLIEFCRLYKLSFSCLDLEECVVSRDDLL